MISSTCFWITTERKVSVTSSRTSRMLKGAVSSCSLSASIFEKSRMSLMIPRRFLAEEWATLTYWCGLGGRSASRARPVMLRIAFIGVRISWLIMARNEPLALLASRASSVAARRLCWDICSVSMPSSSARARVSISPRPGPSPVRPSRSPSARRRAVPRIGRISRRKSSSDTSQAIRREASVPTAKMARFFRSARFMSARQGARGIPRATTEPVLCPRNCRSEVA